MNDEKDKHLCTVCGSEAKTRCSKCYHKGGQLELFFCSEQCQKLVWYAHKRVCGQSLHPAPWPWLSQEECDEAIANRYVKIRYFGKQQNLNEFLWEETGKVCTESHVPEHILHNTEGHPHPFKLFIAQSALNDIRSFETCRKLQSSSGLSVKNCDVINLARAFADRFVIGVPFPAPWYSNFIHRVIILMAVVKHVHDITGDRTEALGQARGACRAFERDCLTESALGINEEGVRGSRLVYDSLLDQSTMDLKVLFNMQHYWLDDHRKK
ncbi:hypothetical protein JCM10908_004786 [Rhodotorula pacifica]|uniref:zinc finger MYND domain-containing protein n=1 Tax=Rhodotorula pacifica TaxID=1495444 RepID=UPI003180BE22